MHTTETFPRLAPVLGAPTSDTFRRDFNAHYALLQRRGYPDVEARELAHTFALREEVRRGSGR
jgi:hypothetical protein